MDMCYMTRGLSLEDDRRKDPFLNPGADCRGGKRPDGLYRPETGPGGERIGDTFHRETEPGMEAAVENGAYVLRQSGMEEHGRRLEEMCSEPAEVPFEDRAAKVLNGVLGTLVEKNRKYGDSALSPVRVFSKANPVEQLLVRIDDKLSRIRNEQGDEDEDVVTDLIGYLVLLKLAREDERREHDRH